MTKVFTINIYEYNTYSYSGQLLSITELFSSEEGAHKWAESHGYTIVRDVKNPEKEVELDTQELRD